MSDGGVISVTHISEPVTGGLGRHLDLLVKALPRRGVRLRLIVSTERDRGYAAKLEEYRAAGVECDVVPMKRGLTPLRDFSDMWRLGNLLRETRPDLVHTHSSKAGFIGRRAANIVELPTVHTPHVFAFEWAGGIAGRIYRTVEKTAAQWCDRLVLLSDLQQDIAVTEGIAPLCKMEVIPNGVDCAEFAPATAEQRLAAREKFGVPPGGHAVGMAARFDPQKGVGDFLRAAKLVHEQLPETFFLLAGDGPLEGEFQTRAATLGFDHAVRFCGNVKHMPEFYHALDCFALASLWEGCPYVVLEAQACAVPVVASKTAGSESLIDDGETGLLVPVAESMELSEALRRVLTDRKLAKYLGSWGRAQVEQRHSLGKWADALVALYRDVLEKRRRGASGDRK